MITNPRFLNRLRKEYTNITTTQSTFQVKLVDDDLQKWVVSFVGPKDTAYEGLQFRVQFDIPDEWPIKIPSIRFLSKVYHPNVYSDGRICLNVIQTSAYSPAATLESQLYNIILLLQEPNCSNPANGTAARMFEKGYKEYCEAVRKEHRPYVYLLTNTSTDITHQFRLHNAAEQHFF